MHPAQKTSSNAKKAGLAITQPEDSEEEPDLRSDDHLPGHALGHRCADRRYHLRGEDLGPDLPDVDHDRGAGLDPASDLAGLPAWDLG